MAVGDFVRADDEAVEGRPISYFGARGRVTPEDLMRTFGRTPAIMRWLERRLGIPFPFAKYYQFALPQLGGAMENISLVSWDDYYVQDETLSREIGEWVDLINVHEMAHSYFGDAVVIRDFAHAWLKESWATYIESCWYFEERGEDEGRYNLYVDGRAYMKEADERYVRPIVTRVFNASWDMYDLHLYPGGACRLHMLRRLVGEEPFWAAVREFLESFSGRTAETEDFRRIVEAHSGLSLVRFFDQWIYGRGYPKLKMTFAHEKEREQGVFTLEQTQVPEKESKRDENSPILFDLPLTIAWEDPGGAWETRTFEVSERKHTFVVAMAAPPRQIRIDPSGDLLFRLEFNPGDEMLRRALAAAPDLVGRILAAEELARTGKAANLEAVGEACRKEFFWGARRAMAKAITDSKSAAAVPILVTLLEEEENPRVLSFLALAAGDYRDERVAAALTGVLGRSPEYFVRNRALKALGQQRGEAHLEPLAAAAGEEGAAEAPGDYRAIVRAGGLRGLAETRSEAAFERLLGRVRYGAEPDDNAGVAIEALAASARFMERRLRDRAVEALCDALRDPRERVRMSAIHGLGALRAKEAAPQVETAMCTLPLQDHPRVRRLLLSMRAGDGDESQTAKLTKRIEELEEKSRKLEERLDRLAAEAEVNPSASSA
jgi:aminopeptidase N